MILRILLWLLFLPLQIGLLALFALTETLRLLTFPRQNKQRSLEPCDRRSCTVVVLNWNGKSLLAESLPALERAVAAAGGNHEILVVDNGSSDGSSDWVRENHPGARLLELERNLGFGEGNNRGVEAARHDVVVLLNNDMIVGEGFLAPLLEGFDDPSVFAVAAQIHFPEGKRREETGCTRADWRLGYPHLAHSEVVRAHETRGRLPVLWAGGGSSAFHRRRFLELGGFDPIFSPCYLEDTDLSYRAWRRGWKTLFAPAAQAIHKHRSSSLKRFDERRLGAMVEERKLWYVWRNYQLRTLAPHLLLYPLNLTAYAPVGVYVRSLRKLPRTLLSRIREPRRAVSDKTLFRWIRQPLYYLDHFHPDRHQKQRGPLRALVVSAYLPHLGKHGGAGRVFQLLRRVAQQHQVSLISFVETEDELKETAQAAPYCKRLETVYRGRHQHLSFFPYEPFEEFNSLEFREKLLELLAEEDFDLVHFEWTQMALYADLFPHVPKIMTEIEVNYAAQHSLIGVEPRLASKVRKYYNTLQTLYREVEMCSQVDRVVCVTEADRDYLAGYVEPSKLNVVNTGVDTSYFTPGPTSEIDRDALVYVGAFRHEPNVDAMRFFCRDVFPRILEERPQTHLYIVGSSPPDSVKRLGESPNITVTGFVEDIRDYYNLAQVVIVPLRTGVGIRGKILEGWAAGKAMVATPLACLGIRALHGENILIAEKADEFAMWTLALLRRPEHCLTLGAAGRQTAVQHYEWDKLGNQMSDLYLSICEKRRNISSRPRSDKALTMSGASL